jgi:hypothetical protein
MSRRRLSCCGLAGVRLLSAPQCLYPLRPKSMLLTATTSWQASLCLRALAAPRSRDRKTYNSRAGVRSKATETSRSSDEQMARADNWTLESLTPACSMLTLAYAATALSRLGMEIISTRAGVKPSPRYCRSDLPSIHATSCAATHCTFLPTESVKSPFSTKMNS